MKVLELEKKFVLDHARFGEIEEVVERFSPKKTLIRQFYEKNKGDVERFRDAGGECVLEQKDGMNIDTDYSISRERSMVIPSGVFEAGWRKSKRRLTKLRYTVDRLNRDAEDFATGHTLMVDFFLTVKDILADTFNERFRIYAVIAETETIIDAETKRVDLNFRLPVSLRPFCLWAVDRRDPRAKHFSSINMRDELSTILAVETAIKGLT